MSDLLPQVAPPPQAQPPQPMGMVPNPAFMQWQQDAQAWVAERDRRQKEFNDACALLKEDAPTRFKIDIEADSTIAADEEAEKKSRVEFLSEITPFLETVIPGMMANPALAPLAKEIGMFAVRGFKVSRPLEEAFENAFDALAKQAEQNPTPPGGAQKPGNTKSPMEIQTEAAVQSQKNQVAMVGEQVKMAQIQADTKIASDKLAAEELQHQRDASLRAREMQGQEALETARISHMASRDTAGIV